MFTKGSCGRWKGVGSGRTPRVCSSFLCEDDNEMKLVSVWSMKIFILLFTVGSFTWNIYLSIKKQTSPPSLSQDVS